MNIVDEERRNSGMDHYDLPLDGEVDKEDSEATSLLPRIQVGPPLLDGCGVTGLPHHSQACCDPLEPIL